MHAARDGELMTSHCCYTEHKCILTQRVQYGINRVLYLLRSFENATKYEDDLTCITSAVQVQGDCIGSNGKELVVRQPIHESLTVEIQANPPMDRHFYVFALPKASAKSICNGNMTMLVSCSVSTGLAVEQRIWKRFRLTPEHPVADIALHAGPFSIPQRALSGVPLLRPLAFLLLLVVATVLATRCIVCVILPTPKLRTKLCFPNIVQKQHRSFAFMKGQKVNLPRDQFTPWDEDTSGGIQSPALFLWNGAKILTLPKQTSHDPLR